MGEVGGGPRRSGQGVGPELAELASGLEAAGRKRPDFLPEGEKLCCGVRERSPQPASRTASTLRLWSGTEPHGNRLNKFLGLDTSSVMGIRSVFQMWCTVFKSVSGL